MTAPKTSTRDAKRRVGKTRATHAQLSPGTLESAVLRALAQAGRPGIATARSEIVRVRPRGTIDRRIRIDYLPDPENATSVLLRLTPASNAGLPASGAPLDLMTTQQAAEVLQVSRPYVTKLVDSGVFNDVVRTAAGHRRIPVREVERVLAQMKLTRREALNQVEALSEDQFRQELAHAAEHDGVRGGR